MRASVYPAILRKNNERPLGITMKKLIILLLVFAMLLCLPGCSGKKGRVKELCEIAQNAAPTKIITEVSLVTTAGDSLKGYYVTVTDGTNAIFEYNFDRFATPAESVESGDYSRIIHEEGVINYKDGTYFSGDAETWRPGTGTAFDLKLNFDSDLFKGATVSEDKNQFEITMNAEDLKAFIGTDLNTVGDATVAVETNGRNLTLVTVSCTTANGTLIVRTSYTYNRQNLFPEEEGEA